ncbi:MAG: 30S ribosomal protein S4 [Verrucomicrobia bacterium]|nr:MAG: 30S ribosomal protein S4 [Verrucomicrobiota bacterium]
MSRYTGPTTKINRRFGQALFPENKAMQKKPYIPGQHGPHLRRRVTDYSMGLNEKQKLRFMYGLSEKQFRLTFQRAKATRGVTGEIFMRLLETRLDNIIYLLGFARTRKAARQFVTHGHVQVNGGKVDIPSYTCVAGDVVEVRERSSSRQLAQRALDESQLRTPPAWLERVDDAFRGTVSRLPIREEMDQTINDQLVVEFYSR